MGRATWSRALWALALGLSMATAAPGCREHPDDGTTPTAAADLPALAIHDDSPNLMLTWIDERGGTHVEMHPADVPSSSRDLVRVVVSDKEDGTRDLFYVVDLSKKDAAGGYTARTMRRRDWEALLEKRRLEHVAKTAPPPPASGSGAAAGAPPRQAPPAGGVAVIIYGASWCHPCHEAAAYLKSKGVPFVMKDIEESEAARVEMQDKLANIGRRGGSIPVIDVRGEILVGFSAAALDRALAKAAGTML